MQELFRGATGTVAHVDPKSIRDAGPINIAPKGGQQFRTPSGKLEFYSETHGRAGPRRRCPTGSPTRRRSADAARWPLRLLTAPGYFQSHTAYSGVAFLREREGAPCCILHPDEARAPRPRRRRSRCGSSTSAARSGLVLRVSDEVQPGVVLVPGQRPDEETVSGTVNMLCSDRYTDIGEGATYQSTFLDVAAWSA